jgi:prepilin-type N-terminal cleavage/methylation domain-containing protein
MITLAQNRHRLIFAKGQRGFSLIELLVVVAIILIIAAIAVPHLLNARMAASGAAAAESIRTITTASMAYSSTWGNGFPPSLAALGGPAGALAPTCNQALLLDSLITSTPYQKGGYTFGYTPVGAAQSPPVGCSQGGFSAYLVTATPTNYQLTGVDSYCSDEPGTIHFDSAGVPAASQMACELLPTLQ